jgi:hypothetical protein
MRFSPCPGLSYRHQHVNSHLDARRLGVHWTTYRQDCSSDLTLLISKVSEAVLPNTPGNHVGQGDVMDGFIQQQPGVRFLINGGFNHYRKNFYAWPHQGFNVGDPVGLVKIREHIFQDFLDLEHYGFLVQREKKAPWEILRREQLSLTEKYILGCTPLLVHEGRRVHLPEDLMLPMEAGVVNSPSVLGHGLQRHPRTAVGLKEGELHFLTIEGKSAKYDGCTLPELQEVGIALGMDALLNLDGGGSSQFRLRTNSETWVANEVHDEDKGRILGHVLVIFDESLK